jgi:adenine-specific DNA-methyltransferase
VEGSQNGANGGGDDGRKKEQPLELIWPHKDRRLLYDYDEEGKPHPRFAELGVPEPRVLIDLDQYGTEEGKEWDKDSNLLIRGDNLMALKSLAESYAGKVKLIYIDPPFNTAQAFPEYDDGLDHSTWLTMMRDRLELLRDLLALDGSIWVEIDDTEFSYLGVLMDEVFGRDNRITTVTVKRSAGTGHKSINPGPINATDFILGYARSTGGGFEYKPQFVMRAEYDKAYGKWIANIDDPAKKWQIESLPEVFARTLGYEDAKAGRKVMSAATFKKEMHVFAVAEDNYRHVIRLAQPDYEGVGKAAKDMIDLSKKTPGIHHLKRPDYPDMYFIKGDRILFLADKMQPDEEGESETPVLAEKLTNFWDDIAWQGIAKEGGVDFPKNKKPEKLLRRIIALGTEKGDIVLDSFAGSGTTGAVAHKMGRRWIMVELGEHADTLALPRLKGVVAGEDKSGVSKAEGWQGGGGFRYLTLAEPLLEREPELGLVVLNPEYSNGLLLNAVLLREGFTPTGDALLHGQGGERTFAHVTEEFVTADYLDSLVSKLPDGGTITVYCLAFDSELTVPEGVVLRKLPGDLANRYCEVATLPA